MEIGSGRPLPQNPTGVQLCAFSNGGPTKRRPLSGVLLGSGPAAALATLLDNGPPAGPLATQCAARPADALLRFSYPATADIDAWFVEYGCPNGVAYFEHQARILDRALTSFVVATAGAYGLSGAPAPDLFAKAPTEAARAAQKAGFTLQFSGEEIDPSMPNGSVLLQYPPAGMAGIGNQIDVILAAHSSAACANSQLALDYFGGGASAGNDFGTIEMRDVSARPCMLVGPITVTGLDRNGHPDTQTITYAVDQSLILTASAATRVGGQPVPPGETVADLMLAAEYRDDPTSPDGLCSQHQVVPATWRLVFPDGTRTVANASAGPAYPGFSSLVTCKGQLDTPEPVSAQ